MCSHPATQERIQRIKEHQAVYSDPDKIVVIALPEEVLKLRRNPKRIPIQRVDKFARPRQSTGGPRSAQSYPFACDRSVRLQMDLTEPDR